MQIRTKLKELDWLIEELETSLQEASDALEAYLSDPEDEAQIRFCLGYIHQVHGSLVLAECNGPRILSEEMELLAEQIHTGRVNSLHEAGDVLIQAILRLPAYVREVIASGQDKPETLLLLLNELRAVRNQPLLSEGAFFSPMLDQPLMAAGSMPMPKEEALKALLRKLRQMYQFAVLGIIKNQNVENNLAYLGKVFLRLQELSKGTEQSALWLVASALAENLQDGRVAICTAVKLLLRELDSQLKHLLDGGLSAFREKPEKPLLKNLLFYIAYGNSSGQYSVQVSQKYQLKDALPKGASVGDEASTLLFQPDVGENIAGELNKELNAAKDRIERTVIEDSGDVHQLTEAAKKVQRVADALAVVGAVQLRDKLKSVIVELEECIEGKRAPTRQNFDSLATKLVEVEIGLQSWLLGDGSEEGHFNRAEVERAEAAVLRESRNGLEAAKEVIVEFIASQWNREHLQKIPPMIAEVAGALEMISMTRACQVLKNCNRYLQEELIDGSIIPDWNSLDALADAMTSVEYYLEFVGNKDHEGDDAILAVAEKSVAGLGYPTLSAEDELESAELETALEGDDYLALQAENGLEEAEPEQLLQGDSEPEQAESDLVSEDLSSLASDLELLSSETLSNDEIMAETSQELIDLEESGLDEAVLDAFSSEEIGSEEIGSEEIDIENIGLEEIDLEDIVLESIDLESSDQSSVADQAETLIELEELAAVDNIPTLSMVHEPEQQAEPEQQLEPELVAEPAGEETESATSATSEAESEPVVQQIEPIEEEIEPIDPEILDIFVEEVDEVLAEISQHYPLWAENLNRDEALTEIRRGFHTLKGSGRMVRAEHVGDLSWSVENLLNKVMAGRVETGPVIVRLVGAAKDEIGGMVSQFKADGTTVKSAKVQTLIDYADTLARGEDVALSLLDALEADSGETSAPAEARDVSASAPSFDAGFGEENQQSPEDILAEKSETETETLTFALSDEDADDDLLDIFVGEAREQIAAVAEFISHQQREAPLYSYPSSDTQRALHTLKGSAFMAGINPVGELVMPLEKFVKELYSFQQPVNEEIVQLLADAVYYVNQSLAQIEQRQPVHIPHLEHFVVRLNELYAQTVEPLVLAEGDPGRGGADPSALRHLMISGMQELMDADDVLKNWRADPANTEGLATLLRELGDLKSASDQAGVSDLSDAAEQMAAVYQQILDAGLPPSDELVDTLVDGHGALLDMVDRVAARQPCGNLDAALQEKLQQQLQAQLQEQFQEPLQQQVEEPEPVADEADETQLVIAPLNAADVDPDILQTFIEEGDELLDDMDQTLAAWAQDLGNADLPAQLKRALHTLKGGARMAGVVQLGDMGHAFEDDIDRLMLAGKLPNKQDFSSYESQQSSLLKVMQAAKGFLAGDQPVAAEPEPRGEDKKPEGIPDALQQIALAVQSQQQSQPVLSQESPVKKPRLVQQEMIKVAAQKLESLINLAGETSIARSRVMQQIIEFGGTLDEMDSTVRRLQDQVRRIGVETDAQIVFRQEQLDASNNEDFDPLEMDHYSQLQQLARSLLESASDIHDLKTTLSDKSRSVEALLVEQGRINTDLQESMMQTRMVPFSRMVPRLRRMVRQLSGELDKRVELKVEYVEGEIDRTVMENVLAPLEHLLRNSLDHGIEPAEERRLLGKPEEGIITIGMRREGGDILIRIADDGRGLNLQAIRNKAISLGMLDAETILEDQEIIQFIFQSGFTTAAKVSQVSGRGVGMDVVNSQIRQLGGAIETETKAGEGSSFTIRLPFTVSINRALMVRVAEDVYALPLNTIGGVVRIKTSELEYYYRYPDARLEYAGGKYQVRHLGSLLKEGVVPTVNMDQPTVALILVHSKTRLFAVQVDELLESAEVVVKGLGRQFSAVPGLSGATILGDGTVVVILDLLALLRATVKVMAGVELVGQGQLEQQPGSQQAVVQTVLVVDDSVTVRKVTGRMLTRQGFHVLTAKDGIDAMRVLQENTPDVILLDIEMPRMDGFELATRLHKNPDLRNIPVIMITSRTGEKHRLRAEALGVKRYLGKPYQEDVLLEAIDEVINPVVV